MRAEVGSNFSLKHRDAKLDAFFSSSDDGVFYVGHASIIVRLSGKTILFDPVCQRPPYLDSWVFFPSQVMDPRLLEVDAVVVSHCHQDHFDLEFLKQLPATTPIYIVAGRPEFAPMFAASGRTPIEIPVGRLVPFMDDIMAYGVLHEYNTTDSSLVLRNANLSVYHGNDNFVTEATLAPLKKAVGDVHVGCVPFSFIHWYPFLLEGVDAAWKENEASRLINKYLDLGIEQAHALGAELVIPFGANLVYHDDVDSVMNRSVLSPIEFVEYARRNDSRNADRYKAMFAGDFVLKPKGQKMEVTWVELDKATFRRDLQTALRSRKAETAEPVEVDVALASNLTWLTEKLKRSNAKPVDHQIRVESTGSDGLMIEIDLSKQSAERVSEWHAQGTGYHHFKVEPLALQAWLEKRITFEEIIGTRRFRIERVPNEYNLPVLELINNSI